MKNLLRDGCEKMVGWKKGVHVTFETIKGKPNGRIICFFHHLEKTFEVIFLLYTGGTTAPGSYSGDIGKSISGDVHTLPVEVFTILPNPSLLKVINLISEETIQSLSNDHKIFLGLIKIVITGEVVKRWVDMKIGPVVTSRFTTTQTRVVRVWLSTANPSFELTRVMHYLVYVWAEVFLTVKHLNRFVDAPRLLLLEVMLTSKHCSYPEKTLLSKSLSHNGQMAHPENVLLAMLAASKAEERKTAMDVIFSIRVRGPLVWETNSVVRPFKREHHQVNMNATSLETLNINPLTSALTEPPTTRSLSGPDLLKFLEQPLQLDLPACSVAVERGVKEVTETDSADSEERDGLVFQKIASRDMFNIKDKNNVYGVKKVLS